MNNPTHELLLSEIRFLGNVSELYQISDTPDSRDGPLIPDKSNLDGYQQLMQNYLTLQDDSSQSLADKIKQEAMQKKLNKMMKLKMNLMGN